MDFPELSENVIAQWLAKYKEGELPPHAQATLNMMRYARWAKWKIHRQKGVVSEHKQTIITLSVRVQQLRLNLDELKNLAEGEVKNQS